ncbi:MAG: glycosyltransferase family 4 protein [Lachnospiraceae bacterium]|nr:glycosyltransferase family 4 protein [Lachnospiraceae bacterium]
MKKVLYIDMAFHIKTKSSNFVVELLETRFLVDKVYINSFKLCEIEESVRKYKYDYLVLWQLMPTADFLNELSFNKGIFFPMYDAVVGKTRDDWEPYKAFTIINFSKTLHDYLCKEGFCSKYIQFFPKPEMFLDNGEENSLFFWQRTNDIHINQCLEMCEELNLKKIHIHKALDPNRYFVPPNKKYRYNFTYSKWFEKKQDLIDTIEKSAYYVAPRRYEGIGMSFLDAMAMGRCVIAPDYPTMNEYIQDGVTGILYDYENPKPIMLRDVREIQKNAYQYIKEGHQKWQKEKYKILDWIEEGKEIGVIESKKKKDESDELKKMQLYFEVLCRWLLLKNRNVSIEKYFLDKGIKKIAVYGYTELTSQLEEELEGTMIEVECCIDKVSKVTNSGKMTISPNEEIPIVDMIVVTPVFYFDSIYADLSKKTNVPIVSLKKIICELLSEL